jgi:drug/metabolite transporter (DMT)-like permease
MSALWMILATLLFSGMGACVKLASTGLSVNFSTLEVVLYRSLVALVLVGSFACYKRWSIKTPHLAFHFKRGLAGLGALVLWYYAIATLPLPIAMTLNYTSPLFLALLTALKQRKKPSAKLWLYLLLGFVGVTFMAGHELFEDKLSNTLSATASLYTGQQLLSIGLGVLSGFLAANAYLQVQSLGKVGEPEWKTVFYFSVVCLIGALIFLILLLLFSPQHSTSLQNHEPKGWLYVLGVGLFGTMAQLALTRAYSKGKALLAANLQYTGVLFSAALGWLIWRETLGTWQIIGCVLIIVSSALATLSHRQKKIEVVNLA